MSQQGDPKYIEELVHRFRNGQIDAAELDVLMDWYKAHDDSYVEILVTDEHVHRDQVKARILNALTERIRQGKGEESTLAASLRHPQKSGSNRRRWSVAAAVLVFAMVAGWSVWEYIDRNDDPTRREQFAGQDLNEIGPGGNKAILILADGREIPLSTDQEGIRIGEQISYLDGTALADGRLHELHSVGAAAAEKLILQTPKGGTYQVTLPDGTEVWLNAGTTLTYPSRFSEDQRRVEVTGEAYFAVHPSHRSNGSKIPFRVITSQQEIEVLGTEFNISAYADQPYSKTTLVDGKVRLRDDNQVFVLQPGDQATTGKNAKTTVKQVSTGTFTAWRDGRFSFDGKPFAEIMNEIAHWYDLEVVYEGSIPNEELVGDAFRNQNLGLVLRVLDVAEIDYSIDVPNRKLIIIEKTNKPKS